MIRTLKPGVHQLVFSRRINDQIADDQDFTKFVMHSILRFNHGDWGNVGSEDWTANNSDLASLNSGSSDARILATYRYTVRCRTGWHPTGSDVDRWRECLHEITIWIIRNTAEEDGTQAITVLFPDEY